MVLPMEIQNTNLTANATKQALVSNIKTQINSHVFLKC